jgi:hypothetical protein
MPYNSTNKKIWPYDGPIDLIEKNNLKKVMHFLDQWMYYGSAVFGLNQSSPKLFIKKIVKFDLNDYKILCQAIYKSNYLEIINLEYRQ